MMNKLILSTFLICQVAWLTGQNSLTPDYTFGDSGKVQLPTRIHHLLEHPNGLIIVLGSSDILALLPNGSLAPNFGSGGIASLYGTINAYQGICLQSDGKILVVGNRSGDIIVERFAPDGGRDLLFGQNGKVTIDNQSQSDQGCGITVDEKGRILVCGYTTQLGGKSNMVVARLLTDGTLDPTFSSNGVLTIDFGGVGTCWAYDIVSTIREKILIAGGVSMPSSSKHTSDFAVVRINNNGTLDTSFDFDGRKAIDFGLRDDFARKINIKNDGKILLTGRSYIDNIDFGLAQLNPDGSLDHTFSFDGRANIGISTGDEEGYTTSLQPDGKLIIAGYETTTVNKFALVRLLPDGQVDLSFENFGSFVDDIGNQKAYSMLLQQIAINDYRIIMGGTQGTVTAYRISNIGTSTSLDDMNASLNSYVKLFPNPVETNTFTLEVSELGSGKILLIDLQGKVLLAKEFQPITKEGQELIFSLPSWLMNGMYQLVLETDQVQGTIPFHVLR
ncbi:MAG: T9SS type A sorting domain-containing protein [Bacteroidota bacterium]